MSDIASWKRWCWNGALQWVTQRSTAGFNVMHRKWNSACAGITSHRWGISWQVDETDVKIRKKWIYWYRAMGTPLILICRLRATRGQPSAFWQKSLISIKPWAHPETINTDKAARIGLAIDELKEEGKCPKDTVHQQVKYLNNTIEPDHSKLKRLGPLHGCDP